MSDDFADAALEVAAALAEYGEPVKIERPASGYNRATRTRATGIAQTQTVQGLTSTDAKGNSRFGDSQAKRYERTLIASPDGMTFDIAIGDLVTAEGRVWRVEGGVQLIRGFGVLVATRAGLVGA